MGVPPTVAIFGPTGVGKTDVAIELAERLRTWGHQPVAVSADALQVYRGLETLTGAATRSQRARLEHRLISFLPIQERFSVAEYAALAHAEIDGLLAAGSIPIVIGGTGLYLRSALTELDLRPPPGDGIREHWSAELERRGTAALHAELARRAPWAAAEIAPQDRHRIVRALELDEAGELVARAGPSQLWTQDTRHDTLLVGLVMERAALVERIEARARKTARSGAIEEVRAAHAAGASQTARKALGFAELLAGDVDAMVRRTRTYSKRQLTWMRKLAGIEVLDVTGRTAADVAAQIALRAEPHLARPR